MIFIRCFFFFITQPDLAGKITGMLLEMENNELLQLLDTPDALNSKVTEALVVLQDFQEKAAPDA